MGAFPALISCFWKHTLYIGFAGEVGTKKESNGPLADLFLLQDIEEVTENSQWGSGTINLKLERIYTLKFRDETLVFSSFYLTYFETKASFFKLILLRDIETSK